MIKQTVKYEDFNGNQQEEDLYFHLSKAELVNLEASTDGGLSTTLPEMIASQDLAKIMELFNKMISLSYGEKSEDGKRFVKDPIKTAEFMSSPAYDALFGYLVSSPDAAVGFITGIVPKDLAAQIAADSSAAPDVVINAENDEPPWIRENRKPTNRELISMDKDQLLQVMRRDRASQE